MYHFVNIKALSICNVQSFPNNQNVRAL